MQFVVEGHETPRSWLVCTPLGFGVRGIVQLLPFQRSASVSRFRSPTAVQVALAGHETPDRTADRVPAGLEVRWIVQS